MTKFWLELALELLNLFRGRPTFNKYCCSSNYCSTTRLCQSWGSKVRQLREIGNVSVLLWVSVKLFSHLNRKTQRQLIKKVRDEYIGDDSSYIFKLLFIAPMMQAGFGLQGSHFLRIWKRWQFRNIRGIRLGAPIFWVRTVYIVVEGISVLQTSSHSGNVQ